MRVLMLSLAAVLVAGTASAEEAMSTAGASGAAPPADATARQIERWIADSPAAAPEPDAEMLAREEDGPRRIHGEIGVAVGTGGYRSGYVVAHMPFKNGSATVAFGKTDFGNHFRPVYGYPGLTPFE